MLKVIKGLLEKYQAVILHADSLEVQKNFELFSKKLNDSMVTENTFSPLTHLLTNGQLALVFDELDYPFLPNFHHVLQEQGIGASVRSNLDDSFDVSVEEEAAHATNLQLPPVVRLKTEQHKQVFQDI